MANGRPPPPQPPLVIPPIVPPIPTYTAALPPAQPIASLAQPIQPAPMPQLKRSHFKPEFAGKPDEDADAYLLRTNDWIDTHAFPEDVKVKHLCLTLAGEAGLWYESLRPINLDWNGLQNQFWQKYSKTGNTREQLFHVWRSFHFDKNTETTDSYVTCIRQVATMSHALDR